MKEGVVAPIYVVFACDRELEEPQPLRGGPNPHTELLSRTDSESVQLRAVALFEGTYEVESN